MLQIAQVNVAGATLGQVFNVPIGAIQPPPHSGQYAQGVSDSLVFYNESHAGFLVTLPNSGRSFTLIAGGRKRIPLTVLGTQDISATLTTTYVLANPAVTLVLVDYYPAGEEPDQNELLGNSPVNISGSGIVANNIVNTSGSIAAQFCLTTIAGGIGQGFNLFTDGTGTWSVADNGVLQSVISVAYSPSPQAVVKFGMQTDPSHTTYYGLINSLNADNGALVTNGAGVFTTVGGVALGGTFGIAVPVHNSGSIHVTTNAAVNLLNFTPTNNASYRVFVGLTVAGSPTAISLTLSYNNVNNTAIAHTMVLDTGTALSGANLPNNEYFVIPVMMSHVQSTANIVLQFVDNVATPNDRVNAYIEQIA